MNNALFTKTYTEISASFLTCQNKEKNFGFKFWKMLCYREYSILFLKKIYKKAYCSEHKQNVSRYVRYR